MTKICRDKACSQPNPQPLNEFMKRSKGPKDGLSYICKTCIKTKGYAKRWKVNNPERARELQKRNHLDFRCRKVGITTDYYNSLPKRCSFKHCKATKPGGSRGGKGDWIMDHNHKTGKFRGLLCHSHNTLLGHAHDNVEELQDAILYLGDKL